MHQEPSESTEDNLSRRNFMVRGAVVTAVLPLWSAHGEETTQPGDKHSQEEPAPAKALMPKHNTPLDIDVLVVGGGPAGITAAIQAARAGASTILLESGSQLGGTTATAGVNFPGLFHAWGKQVIAGIGWELVEETVRMGNGRMPDFSVPYGRSHVKFHIPINPYLYVLLAEEKCGQAGVRLRYYETPISVRFRDHRWEVEVVGKGTSILIRCKQLIDCTGNAIVVQMAGLPVLRSEVTQPGTLMFKIDGYDLDKVDKTLLNRRCQEAVDQGRLKKEDHRNRILGPLGNRGGNTMHTMNADSTTSETHTDANIRARKNLLDTLRFYREIPGLEKLNLVSMPTEIGIRETYRIVGEYQITEKDYVAGRKFEDAWAYSFYPIDLHKKGGVATKHLEEGVVPTISMRAQIPKNSRNLLVAGRCVSSDQLANSALRVQASCMAMGQAAGVAAALACSLKTTPLDVPLDRIKTLIAEHGGIVP